MVLNGLDDTDMLGEIIWEVIEIHENTEITKENVLCLAKRIEAQRAQSAIMNSLTEAKEFDKLKIVKNTYKDSIRRSPTWTKSSAKHMCRSCVSSQPPRQCLAYGKCTECRKLTTSEW